MFNAVKTSNDGLAGLNVVTHRGYVGFVVKRSLGAIEGYCGYILIPLNGKEVDTDDVELTYPTPDHEDGGITYSEVSDGFLMLGFDRLHSWSSKHQTLDETIEIVKNWIDVYIEWSNRLDRKVSVVESSGINDNTLEIIKKWVSELKTPDALNFNDIAKLASILNCIVSIDTCAGKIKIELSLENNLYIGSCVISVV